MIKNYFLSVLFILFISCKEQNFTKSPNVILIITDDQGYGDLGINKNPILKTPNIDELSSKVLFLITSTYLQFAHQLDLV